MFGVPKNGDIRTIAVHSDAADSVAIAALCTRAQFDVTLIDPDRASHERLRSHLNALGGVRCKIVASSCESHDLAMVSEKHSSLIQDAGLGVLTQQPQDCDMAVLPSLIFAAPLHLHEVVEVLPGQFGPDKLEKLMFFLSLLQKTPVQVTQSVVLALLDALLGELDELLLRGAFHTEIDDALRNQGAPRGVFETQDLIGLERAYSRRRCAGVPRLLVQDRMIEEGRLGKHVGVGWYRYPGGGGAVEDPLIEDLIAEEAHFAGIQRKDIPADHALKWMLDQLRLTRDRLVQGGVPPETIDLACTQGLGLPQAFVAQLSAP